MKPRHKLRRHCLRKAINASTAEPELAAEPELDDELDELDDAFPVEDAELQALHSSGELDPALLTEWDSAGGADFHLERVQNTALSMLDAMPDGEDFQSGFDGLPASAQTAVYAELALSPGGSAQTASDAELVEFASTEEGAQLVQEWRGRAGRNIATVRARLDRMLGRMSPDDMDTTLDWFDALPSAQAKAVLHALAGL